MFLRYRTVKHVTRAAKTGHLSPQSAQYLVRRGVEDAKRVQKRAVRKKERELQEKRKLLRELERLNGQ